MRTRRARDRKYWDDAAYVRRKRQRALVAMVGAAAAGIQISPQWIAVIEAVAPIIIEGIIRGRFGNASIFGSGPRALFQGGRMYDINASVGSGGIR